MFYRKSKSHFHLSTPSKITDRISGEKKSNVAQQIAGNYL